MKIASLARAWLALAGLLLATLQAVAADFPAPKHGNWVVRDFKFHSGQVLPELRLAYSTVGEPSGEPVLVLHGTTGSAASMLGPNFGGELFGAGQPLDATKYFIILPDAIGTGRSSKPSDGLRMNGPDRAKADAALEARLKANFAGDANDHLLQWESSGDYDPSKGLEKITATLLAINSADDERNPVELGILEREIKRVKNGRAYVIPVSEQTLGHGTTGNARFWKQELERVLREAPRIGM